MHDGKKIIPGILIFLGILLYPFLHNAVNGKTGYDVPKLELPQDEKVCIEPRAVMRTDHARMLDRWRTSAVRRGVRTYTAKNKRTYPISLNRTCMRCHADRTTFCDRCHDYLAVDDTACWDCHMTPKQTAREVATPPPAPPS